MQNMTYAQQRGYQVLLDTFRHVENGLSYLDPDRSNSYKEGAYPFIPFESSQFIELLQCAESVAQGSKFLDIGAGFGTKMLLARGLGYEAYGIEMNPKYVEWSKRFASYGMELADARTYEKYHLFDVLYFYCPMANTPLQLQLEKAVYKGARDGAILIQALKRNDKKRREPHLHQINDLRNFYCPVFVKDRTGKLVDDLRKRWDDAYKRVTGREK